MRPLELGLRSNPARRNGTGAGFKRGKVRFLAEGPGCATLDTDPILSRPLANDLQQSKLVYVPGLCSVVHKLFDGQAADASLVPGRGGMAEIDGGYELSSTY